MNALKRRVSISSRRCPEDGCWKPTQGSLIDEAKQLQALNFTRAAGCLARQAIERGLIEWCQARGVWPRHPASGRMIPERELHLNIRYMIGSLQAAQLLDSESQRQVELAIAVGNHACHAKTITPPGVYHAIEVAERIHRIARREGSIVMDDGHPPATKWHAKQLDAPTVEINFVVYC